MNSFSHGVLWTGPGCSVLENIKKKHDLGIPCNPGKFHQPLAAWFRVLFFLSKIYNLREGFTPPCIPPHGLKFAVVLVVG